MAIREGGATQHPSAPLSPFREWTRLEGAVLRSDFRRGSTIFSAGEPSDFVCLVKSGQVKVIRHGPGPRSVIVQLAGPGDLFGDAALFGETQRESSAEALEDAAVWIIPRKGLLEFTEPRPELWQSLAAVVGKRVRVLEHNLASLLFLEVEERLIRVLLSLNATYGYPAEDGIQLRIDLSQRELAHLVGSTRETTSSILNRLSKQGLIRIRRRRVTICSLEELSGRLPRVLPAKRPPQAAQRRAAVVRSASGDTR